MEEREPAFALRFVSLITLLVDGQLWLGMASERAEMR
jgi:hypothetical protein